MANSPRRVYWDACSWIALIQREKIAVGGSDRDTLCRAVIAEAKKNKIEILTSTLSLVEVCKNPKIRTSDEDQIGAYFENDYILLMNVDRLVGEHARMLMIAGHTGLKPPDAIHVASAILGNVSEFHTFDGGGAKKGLLDLDQTIDRLDGGKLRICTPDVGGTPPPLLSGMQNP
jgi:predicted nucleic acid-binding protein